MLLDIPLLILLKSNYFFLKKLDEINNAIKFSFLNYDVFLIIFFIYYVFKL